MSTVIAHISDLHYGAHSDAIAEALQQDLHTVRPNVVCVSGDLTQRALHREFVRARDFLQALPYPYIVIPGNHDIPLWNVAARLLTPFRSYRRHITPDLQPGYTSQDVCIVSVNTSRGYFWKQGIVWWLQRRRLATVFADAPQGACRMVMTHHPCMLPTGSLVHRRLRGWKKALHSMGEAGVHILLSGHIHTGSILEYHWEETQGVPILISQAGTAASMRTRMEHQSYNVITISHDTIRIATRSWVGNKFVETTNRTFIRTR